MSDPTLAVYEQRAQEWHDERVGSVSTDGAHSLVDATSGLSSGPLVDLGCGPGWHTGALGPGAVAMDGAAAMLDLVPGHAPEAHRVRGDLRGLPFRPGSLRGALATRSYVHLPRTSVPLALADLHRSLAVEGIADVVLFGGDEEHGPAPGDDFPGRRFSLWPRALLDDVLVGAGFDVVRLDERPSRHDLPYFHVRCRRARTLADTVGPDMRLLVCGLNPSLYAADRGLGFARPGNRFWPAALAAGLVSRDRDPRHALTTHGVGMTDLVKRATRASAELSRDEYRVGLGRLTRVVEWLEPAAVCVVGLEGWRAAVEPGARPGVQDQTLGGRPTYLMPSTSGLNAHSRLDDLTSHLRAAAALAGR